MKFLVINGPNINMLGIREPDIYGSQSYTELLRLLDVWAAELDVELVHFQSNHEGSIVDQIQAAYRKFDGIIINPAAYTHTSIAILDALKAVGLPAVEVHISDVSRRDPFRQLSYAGMACIHTIMGQGLQGYHQAMIFLKKHLSEKCPLAD